MSIDASTAAIIGVFVLPHVLYAFVWRRPVAFMAMARRRWPAATPVDVFAAMASALKVAQLIALALWLALHPPRAADLPALASLRSGVAMVALVAGQTLNAAIYWAIGRNGVYYGVRLGAPVPWATGFPFAFAGAKIPHPQYVGSVLTLWAMVLVLYTTTTTQLVPIAIVSSAAYAITAAIEDN